MDLPIVRVTCLEDRAQVERQGAIDLSAGLQKVRIEPVTPLAVDRSLRVELTGATLVDARLVRTYRPKPEGGVAEDAPELRRREHALRSERQALVLDVGRLEWRLELLQHARADLARDIGEHTGQGKAEPGRWREQSERLWAETARVGEALRVVRRRLELTARRLVEVEGVLARAGEEEHELTTAVELSIEAPAAGRATLRVAYLVPCALWRPAYRATLLGGPGGERVGLEAEAVVWQRTGEAWKDVELVFSTARPTLGASPPTLETDRLSLRDKTEHEKQVVEVSLREEEIQTVGEPGRARTSELPGLDDGGEVRVLAAPHRATVPPDGQPHRVPLFSFESPARTERLCTPERSPLASLVARFENRSRHPLLAGPVDLVRESGFVGRGELKYAAAGEGVRVSFGSEDAVRVTREVTEKVSEAMLTGRRTRTRTVRLFVSNAGSAPVRLALEERIPVSELAAVEVKLLKGESKPAPDSVSAEGLLRYELDLEGRARREIGFSYEVSAAAKVAGL